MSIANALKAVLVVMTLSAIGFAAAFMYEYRMNRTLRKEMAASTTTLRPTYSTVRQTKTTTPFTDTTVFDPTNTQTVKTTVHTAKTTTDILTTTPDIMTTAVATTGVPFPYDNLRLPNTLYPTHYNIVMHPDLDNLTFSGTVDIIIKIREDTNVIVLHSYLLEHENTPQLFDEDNTEVPVDQFLTNLKHEQIYLSYKNTLKEVKLFTLKMKFNGVLRADLHGFYRSRIVDSQGNNSHIAVTQFEATDARRAFPCFDEPAIKSFFQIKITRKEEHISIFNTELISSIPTLQNGMVEDTFEESLKMSSYLVAFAVGDLKKVTRKGKITISAYAPANQIDHVEFALDVCVNVINFYDKFFGIEFPLKKMDLLSVNDFAAGAMENWGLITFAHTDMLFTPNVSTYRNRQRVAVVVAHELGHQWFGDLVTMKWWSDIWLNEGFASFMEYQGTNNFNPEWRMLDQFLGSAVSVALDRDCYTNSHPIQVEVHDPEEISQLFDSISYSKGSSVLRMIESFMGKEKLQSGLKSYLNKFRYGNTETDDLWDSLTEQMPEIDIKSVMNTWTRQMNYPLISMKMNVETGLVEATQNRFLLDADHPQKSPYVSPYGYKWHVPLMYFTNNGASNDYKTEWMHMKNISFTLAEKAEWIYANKNHGGFYRVLYETANYNALIKQLNTDMHVFTPSDRAGLLMDVITLHGVNKVDTEVTMNLLAYLKHELDFLPWQVSVRHLESIGHLLRDDKIAYAKYETWIHELLNKAVNTMKWNKTLDLIEKKRMSILIKLGITFKHMGILDALNSKFLLFKYKNIMNVDFRGAIYQAGVLEGGEEAFTFLLNRFAKIRDESDSRAEREDIVYALSHTDNAARLKRYLKKSMQENIMNSRMAFYCILYASSGEIGRDIVWQFYKNQWHYIKKRFGKSGYRTYYIILYVASQFSTEEKYKEVKAFLSTHKVEGPAGAEASRDALLNIRANIAWKNNSSDDVIEWLNSTGTRRAKAAVAA